MKDTPVKVADKQAMSTKDNDKQIGQATSSNTHLLRLTSGTASSSPNKKCVNSY